MLAIASFVATGATDWYWHAALGCFRHHSRLFGAIGMTSFKAMFRVDVFEACNDLKLKSADDEPPNLTPRLSTLRQMLFGHLKNPNI